MHQLKLSFKHIIFFLLFLLDCFNCSCQDPINLPSKVYPVEILSNAQILEDTNNSIKLEDIIHSNLDNAFHNLNKDQSYNYKTIWVKFKINNQHSIGETIKISVAFSDNTVMYINNGDKLIISTSGDLVPFTHRKVKVGQICFLKIHLPEKKIYSCYLKLSSSTPISNQFKSFTLKSLKIYNEHTFATTFEKSRIYQAFFYGAVLIMLFFNLFIYFTIKSKSYFYYLLFLSFLILFLSSNSGFLLELVLYNFPALDLYIRFISGPLLIIAYLLFSKDYLQAQILIPKWSKVIDVLLCLFIIIVFIEIIGFWKIGRTLFILTSIISFLYILIIAIITVIKGYGPARYFLAGNILLIIGSTVYAVEHLFKISQNTTIEFGLQNAVLFEIALFSMGLADKFNVVRKELNEALLEKERRAKEAEIERKNLIEDKNKALQISNDQLDAFVYRTAHDIRGPLASVMGLCRLALVEIKDIDSLEYLQKLNNSANKMNYILDRLNTAYEISHLSVTVEKINFNELIDDILNEIKKNEIFKNSSLEFTCSNSFYLHSDSKLIKFIFKNIIENAFKFRDPTKMQHCVSINLQRRETSIYAEIKDNGIGILKEDKDNIYQIFSNAAVKYKSAGLGLYMAKISVEKLKGEISHLSDNCKTVFIIKIPDVVN